jgi:hypothetical protein
MSHHRTTLLSPRQVRGLNKVGDAFIPGDSDLPPFSATGCALHADRILEYLDERDKNDLLTALTVFSFLPISALAFFHRFLDRHYRRFPGGLGELLRQARIGLKGLVVSLYYSGQTAPGYTGPNPMEVIGYKVSVYLDDFRPYQPPNK